MATVTFKRSPFGRSWTAVQDGKRVGSIDAFGKSYTWEAYNAKNMGSMLHKDNRGSAATFAAAKSALTKAVKNSSKIA